MEDLDRAIAMNEQAIKSTPDGHPVRATMLGNLGVALQSRFEGTGSIEDLERIIATYEQAFKSDTAPPSVRLKTASFCSNLLISQKLYSRAKAILRAAVQLLPKISPRQLKRGDQQFNISQFANITSCAVSLCLADAEDPYKSLQLLELGRGILTNLQLEVRSDISVLEASHSDLAQQFRELQDQIDPTFKSSMIEEFSDSTSIPDSSKLITERTALVKRFDGLLQYIRSLQGFENFLQGPSESELRSLAHVGPIVVFNVSEIRSDAFLITTDEIRSVHLPLLTSNSLEKFTNRFFAVIHKQTLRHYRHAMLEVNAVLEWLWDVAVNPILVELGFTQIPFEGETWPRVCWVGCGLLNILPIHASGYHDSTPRKTALDRVISSYAPTVKSLSYARERAARAEYIISQEKAILVAMPTTPGKKPLRTVMNEVKDLENLLSKAFIETILCRPKLWLLWPNSRPHTFFPPYSFLKYIFTKHGIHTTNLHQVKTRYIEPI